MSLYFCDYFKVDPSVLEEYGALNVSLVNDLPLFIDPILLYESGRKEYDRLHETIVKHLTLLRDLSEDNAINEGILRDLFCFPEVKQNWLGFSENGNGGSGLGIKFARSLAKNLNILFRPIDRQVARSIHVEKLALLGEGVGRDSISDLTTNLIKEYLLEYTQTFAKKHIDKSLVSEYAVNNVKYDYASGKWVGGKFILPKFNRDYVMLTPKDILTKDDTWINRTDFLSHFDDIYNALPDEAQRRKIESHLLSLLPRNPTDSDRQNAKIATLKAYPDILEQYVSNKEDTVDEARERSYAKVAEVAQLLIENAKLLRTVLDEFDRSNSSSNDGSYDESIKRVMYFKQFIENNDGYQLLYSGTKPLTSESDLQKLFRLVWFGTNFDFNSEVNNGRGPVDFKVSKGALDKTLVEFKLAGSSSLRKNLSKQVAIYKAANNTKNAITVIFYFTQSELDKVNKVAKELGISDAANLILVDARKKPSASVAK